MGLLTTYALQETDAVFHFSIITRSLICMFYMNVKSNEYIYFLFLFFFFFSFFYRLLVDDMHFKRKNEHIPKSHTHTYAHTHTLTESQILKLKWEQRQRSNNALPLQVFADCQYSLNCHPSATYSATAYSLAPGLSASAWMCPEQSLHCLQSLSLMTAHWPLTDSASSSPRFPWQSDFFSEQGSPACILPKVLKQSPLHPVALSVIPVHSGSVWGEPSCAPPSSCTQVVLIPSWLLVLQWQKHHSLWSAHHQSSVSKNMVRFQFFILGWHGSKHILTAIHILWLPSEDI